MIPGVRRVCLDCGRLTASGSRCEECQAALMRRMQQQRNRPSATRRGYGSKWQATRLAVLERDGWTCQRCGKHLIGADATVDHVIPKARGGTDDPANLAAMCRSHNSSKRDR